MRNQLFTYYGPLFKKNVLKKKKLYGFVSQLGAGNLKLLYMLKPGIMSLLSKTLCWRCVKKKKNCRSLFGRLRIHVTFSDILQAKQL